jgi:tetratricopeptide (TPR) repeat protein
MSKETKASSQICFVDMPFGKKTDPKSSIEIDFDQIYNKAIEPAIVAAGLRSIRGDREKTGGIIHKAMFARLLLSEFVIADLTTANANVFYELGVRHAAKPYTTIPIFATIGGLPFDVNMVRAIPYDLKKGKLTKKAAEKLREDIKERIKAALEGPVSEDSPLFHLFKNFPGIEISHELTDVFMDRIEVAEEFQTKLDIALQTKPKEDVLFRLKELENELGDLKSLDNEVLMKLLLTYRDVAAFDEMVTLYEKFPAALKDSTMARQQLALALNRRSDSGDRTRAIRILEDLLKKRGESAETYGILGRIYKDQYKEAKKKGNLRAAALIDKAIEVYTRGFECEPADYYPGVNAINLLVQKGTKEAQKEIERLTPLVSFAVARRGGAASDDYWDLATVLELALIGRDYESAEGVIAKVLDAAKASWMAHTTADNLILLLGLRKDNEDTTKLEETIEALRERAAELPSK